jgi:WD40 repeat protein
LAFDPQAPRLLLAGQDGRASILDISTGRVILSLDQELEDTAIEADESVITWSAAPAFSPEGDWLALVGGGETVYLFDSASGEQVGSIQVGRPVSALAFGSDVRLLATGSQDGVLSLFEWDTGELLGEWVVQDGFVNSLVFGDEGRILAIAGADGDVIVADFEHILADQPQGESDKLRGRLPAEAIEMTMTGHTDVIKQLDLSPDDTRVLTTSWDGTARLWDLATGEELFAMAGHQGRVWDAAFAPDGGWIVTAGADGALIVWEAESGEQAFVLDSQAGEILSLAFSPDGKYLAASDGDGSTRVYVMPVEDLLALAQDRLTRNLSDEECRRYLHGEPCPLQADPPR